MTLTITMDLDNAAFEDGGVEEVARILKKIVTKLPHELGPVDNFKLMDGNGNTVARAEITD